jgi:hypothetical protein
MTRGQETKFHQYALAAAGISLIVLSGLLANARIVSWPIAALIIGITGWSYISIRLRLRSISSNSIDKSSINRLVIFFVLGLLIVVSVTFGLIVVLPERSYDVIMVWVIGSTIIWAIFWGVLCVKTLRGLP